MKTRIEQIKEIEENLDYFLDTYDNAMLENNEDMVHKAVDCIEHELKKLREFGYLESDINIKTESYIQ